MKCRNCRANDLSSRRERLIGACWRCLAKVDKAIKELGWEPDYRAAYVKDGVRYIPGKGGDVQMPDGYYKLPDGSLMQSRGTHRAD